MCILSYFAQVIAISLAFGWVCTWPTRTGAWSRGCAGTSLSHSRERKELLETPRSGFFSKHSSLVLQGDELFWGDNRGRALSGVKAPEISSHLFQHREQMSVQDIDIREINWFMLII